MGKIIVCLLAMLLTPSANAAVYRYVELDIDPVGGGSIDAIFTEYNTGTSVMTWAVDNMRLDGALMDGFWLVTNNGPANPKGEDGLAIWYADFNSNSLWAFAYGGEGGPDSYNTGAYFGDFSSGLFSLGNTQGFSVNVDSLYDNLLSSGPFDENIGIWFRPTWGTETGIDGNGRLTSFDFSDFSWHDIAGHNTTVVPVPGALLLYASALFGLGWARRTRSS